MQRLIRHPWAIVIGAVVLVAVATGAALARPASTSQVTPAQVKRIARTVADAEIARLAPGLWVKSARTANSPALYAQVLRGGGVTGNSQGITQENVSHPEPGLYCFSGLRNAPQGRRGDPGRTPPRCRRA